MHFFCVHTCDTYSIDIELFLLFKWHVDIPHYSSVVLVDS